jgi:hypothetical protein
MGVACAKKSDIALVTSTGISSSNTISVESELEVAATATGLCCRDEVLLFKEEEKTRKQNGTRLKTKVHIVRAAPVSLDGSPVEAEVVLHGGRGHLALVKLEHKLENLGQLLHEGLVVVELFGDGETENIKSKVRILNLHKPCDVANFDWSQRTCALHLETLFCKVTFGGKNFRFVVNRRNIKKK